MSDNYFEQLYEQQQQAARQQDQEVVQNPEVSEEELQRLRDEVAQYIRGKTQDILGLLEQRGFPGLERFETVISERRLLGSVETQGEPVYGWRLGSYTIADTTDAEHTMNTIYPFALLQDGSIRGYEAFGRDHSRLQVQLIGTDLVDSLAAGYAPHAYTPVIDQVAEAVENYESSLRQQ